MANRKPVTFVQPTPTPIGKKQQQKTKSLLSEPYVSSGNVEMSAPLEGISRYLGCVSLTLITWQVSLIGCRNH